MRARTRERENFPLFGKLINMQAVGISMLRHAQTTRLAENAEGTPRAACSKGIRST